MLLDRPLNEGKGCFDCQLTHGAATDIAEPAFPMQGSVPAKLRRDMDQADRFCVRSPAWSRNSGYRHADINR